MTPTHMIRQQFLHVDFQGTEHEALALQRRLQRFCHDSLIPVIEATLDRHSIANRHLFLERLELDIGQLPVERLEYDLAGSITQALERSLKEELSRAQESMQQKSAHQTVTEAFLYFLETGSLPWWFRLPAGHDLEQAMLSCWRKMDRSGSGISHLQHAAPRLLASSSVRKRLVLQFSPPLLEKMLALLSPETAEVVARILPKVENMNVSAPLLKQFTEKLWESAFATVATGGSSSRDQLVARAWLQLPLSQREQGKLASALELQWPRATRTMKRDVRTITGSQPEVADKEAPDTGRIDRGNGKNCCTNPAAKEGIYVDNAGLVLLHPFLPQLFEALQIAEDDKLLQAERALCLLHFLSAGSLKAPEYELLLPKVLCNLDMQTPVESEVGLTAGEQEECSALLEAVIRHWGALGSSSPDALRGTFLLRPGKLTLREDGDWLLQVESSGCDILLDQLPWAMSMIKLPWMDAMLWVEWLYPL